MDNYTEVDEIGDTIYTKTVAPDFGIYSPYYQGTFEIAERRETPFLNGLRLRLGLDSAEYHTVVVPEDGWVGSVDTTDADRRDMSGAGAATENLESKGYEVIDHEVALDRYGTDVVSSSLSRDLQDRRDARERYENLSEDEQRVYDALCNERIQTTKDVEEQLDIDGSEVRYILHNLEYDGVIESEWDDLADTEELRAVFDSGSVVDRLYDPF